MLRILYTPLAEKDLEDIWLFTAARWSADQAETYTTELVTAVERMARGSTSGRPTVLRHGMLKQRCGRHVIYFRKSGAELVVVRILHQSMDVERHL